MASSSGVNAETSEPQRLNGIESSRHQLSKTALPRTLRRAMSEPGFASKPAWTMAELAREEPAATSSAASTSAIFRSKRERWRAMAQPVEPAPTMAMSKFMSRRFSALLCVR